LHTALKTKTFRAENINWLSTFTTRLTFDDLENIAYLNGTRTVGSTEVFNNNAYKYIKGYVVLNGALTSAQMVSIKKWFGDAAFDKAARNSQLVVDSTSDSVIINADGVTINGSSLELQEGSTASLSATQFLLRESVGQNVVSTSDVGMSADEYRWSIGDGTNWGSSYKSCTIEYNSNDGRMKLIAEEGDYGDYEVRVRVAYIGSGSLVQYSTLIISIIGTTYPTGYTVDVTGTNLREFHVPSPTKSSIFGSYAQYALQDVDTYVLYSPN